MQCFEPPFEDTTAGEVCPRAGRLCASEGPGFKPSIRVRVTCMPWMKGKYMRVVALARGALVWIVSMLAPVLSVSHLALGQAYLTPSSPPVPPRAICGAGPHRPRTLSHDQSVLVWASVGRRLGVWMPGSGAPAGTPGPSARTNRAPTFEPAGRSKGLGTGYLVTCG